MPYSLIVDAASACNFRCQFCFHSMGPAALKAARFAPGVMSMDRFRKVIDQAAEYPRRLKRLSLNMRGEPLLNRRLPDMIAYAKRAGVSESIDTTTNGYLLSPEMNARLIDAGLDHMRVSVEALSGERYEAITGVHVDVPQFVENIRDFYERRGACTLFVKIIDVGLADRDEEAFHALFDDICDSALVERAIPMYADVDYDAVELEFSRDLRGGPCGRIEVCSSPFFHQYVLDTGDVTVCCRDFNGEVVVGSMERTSLRRIWEGAALKALRCMQLKKERHRHAVCGKCDYPSYNTHREDNLDPFASGLLPRYT